jgi:hypothetical protein
MRKIWILLALMAVLCAAAALGAVCCRCNDPAHTKYYKATEEECITACATKGGLLTYFTMCPNATSVHCEQGNDCTNILSGCCCLKYAQGSYNRKKCNWSEDGTVIHGTCVKYPYDGSLYGIPTDYDAKVCRCNRDGKQSPIGGASVLGWAIGSITGKQTGECVDCTIRDWCPGDCNSGDEEYPCCGVPELSSINKITILVLILGVAGLGIYFYNRKSKTKSN